MKLAIIIPYRDREAHLNIFAPHIKSMLPDADILVIEQEPGKPFNRGKLLNIGYLLSYADYFCFHDVDMIPEFKADYSSSINPIHMATKCSQFNYRMPYPSYFGGVTIVNHKHMEMTGGYSNEFWGWGGEDDEFRREIEKHFTIESRETIYECLDHKRDIDWNQHKKNVDRLNKPRAEMDGIDYTIFDIVNIQETPLYKKILVTI